MKHYTTTDTGKIREKNEDNFINLIEDNFSLFIVADGIGGHNSGEIASYMAVKIVRDYIKDNFNKDEIFDLIIDATRKANEEILNRSKNNPDDAGMGTTIVIALIVDNILYYANVGDSRIYLFSNNVLKQITKDHSYVQELLDIGAISEEDAKFYPRNQITSALGTSVKYKIDLNKLELKNNDYVLLNTDGLTDLIEDHEIFNVVKNEYGLQETCEILQYMANATGGYDNITITLVKFEEQNEW